ncbi:MAG: oligoendopeptidase F [Candidatus Zixiibacteriota bacterium]|nr:MAG: oligoendopeptidase F [candidate division Zixibacteria bacterium]
MKRVLIGAVVLSVVVFAFVVSGFDFSTAEVQKARQRSEIDDKYKWSLEDIFADTAAWQADFDLLQSRMGELENYKGRLGESAETLYECLSLQDSLNIILGRLYVYAFMKQDEDTRISEYQQLGGKIMTLNTQFGSIESYINPEILQMPDEKLRGFVDSDSRMETYRFYIEDLIRSKEHILSPEEEKILALAGNATQGTKNIFRMMYNADIKFPTITDPDGNEIEITRQRFQEIMKHSNRDYRREAHKKYNEAQLGYFNSFGAIMASTINNNWFYAQARKYNSCLEVSLDSDNIPPAVLTNLIDGVNANFAPLHKWMSIRKRIMGLDELHGYDGSVPLVPEADKKIPYDEATKILVKALKPMGKDYVKDLEMGMNSSWIDVYESEGKRSGGYNWGSYSTHPYILMNYNDEIINVFTLAHEMGHALHSYYSKRTQPYRTAYSTLFVAEVASTTNESILIDYMLENTKDKKERMYLLDFFIEEIINTFYFQTMLSEFELKIYETVEKGGAVSSESMRQMYTELTQKYWGPDFVIDEWGGWGGIRVPHYNTHPPYYVYKYATGFASAQAISKKILEGDEKARAKYLEFLTWGGNDYPVEQLKKIGVDLTTPDPVNATIAVFSNLVDEMEKLLDES